MSEYLMREGSRGQEVRRLQRALGGLVVDGLFGPRTQKAVAERQHELGMVGTGAADGRLQRALGIEVLPGIDVSAYQRKTDWAEVRASGQRWVYRKATEGRTHRNGGLAADVKGVLANDMLLGLYHFGRPDTNPGPKDARAEALAFIKVQKQWPCTLSPVLDVEKGVKKGWKYNAEWVRDWCDIVEDALECRAVIYTAKWAVDAYLRKAPARALDEIVVRPLWLADYDGYPDDEVAPWSEWTIWQYTGSGKVPGVRGKCDRNWLAGGGLDRIRWSSVRCGGRP